MGWNTIPPSRPVAPASSPMTGTTSTSATWRCSTRRTSWSSTCCPCTSATNSLCGSAQLPLLAGAVHCALEQRHVLAILVRHLHLVHADAVAAAQFHGTGRKHVAAAHGLHVGDGGCDAHRMAAMGIRGKGQCAVRQGIGNAAVGDPEPVVHFLPRSEEH